jgi:polyisoprenoid-binding protein YceI
MNAEELDSRIRSGQPPLLVNVLPEEVFAAERIPGSVNACVYEMAFLDRVSQLAPEKETAIVVYGAGEGSLDSRCAVEKLKTAGYLHVTDLPAGLPGWRSAGFPVEGSGQLPQAPRIDGRFAIDTAESVIRWTGRNLFNHHSGTVRLASGEIHVADGVLESARFVIDMDSIACEDLADPDWNAMLIRHLHDADFFETSRFPTAVFAADEAGDIPNATEGMPNHLLNGKLTLRGVTRQLDFPAVIASADGRRLTGQAQFEIDRTEFGSLYGSGKFFRHLGKHIVNDHIHLHVKIHADSVPRD